MSKKYLFAAREDADLTGWCKSESADFEILSHRPSQRSIDALLRSIARLFVANPAPKKADIDQFEELMVQLMPHTNRKTRYTIEKTLANNHHVPPSVTDALKLAADTATAAAKGVDPADSGSNVPSPSPEALRRFLPLQVPRRMINVFTTAAYRGHMNVLRNLLAQQLRVKQDFVEELLTDPDGFALVVALRALRLPRDVAELVLAANIKDKKFPIEANQNSLATYMAEFDNLDPEASRQQIEKLEASTEGTTEPGQRRVGRTATRLLMTDDTRELVMAKPFAPNAEFGAKRKRA